MLKKISQRISALAFLALLAGCAGAPVAGVLYTDVESGQAATSNQTGNRVGESCASSYVGLVATGDASIEAARRNGGITMITSVDHHTTSVLFFYVKYCTIVRGR